MFNIHYMKVMALNFLVVTLFTILHLAHYWRKVTCMEEKEKLDDGPKAKYLLGQEIIQVNISINISCQSSHGQLGEGMALL